MSNPVPCPLRQKLRSYRYNQSKLIDKPAYHVFSNKEMESIIEALPTNTRALKQIKGFGKKKIANYVVEICNLVQQFGRQDSSSSSFSDANSFATVKRSSSSPPSSSSFLGVQISTSPKISKKKIKPILESQLTAEQHAIAMRVLSGASIFLTGPAGSGKSFLFRFIRQELEKKFKQYGERALAVTAPTGIAAINVNGQTIHSWAGVGLGKGDVEKLYSNIKKSGKVTSRWKSCQTLLIDEVSMLSLDLFQKLSILGARIRNVGTPFGGIQIVCCGDFYQLPPIGLGKWAEFCFKAPAWQDLNMLTCQLTKVIRQQGDDHFVNLLNELRVGKISKECSDTFQRCHVKNKPFPSDGIIPTKLFCTNKNVDSENQERLDKLVTEAVLFPSMDELEVPMLGGNQPSDRDVQKLLEIADAKVPSRLTLKVGAQVVLLRNLRPDLVNGSRGVVVGFQDISAGFATTNFKRQKVDPAAASGHEILWSGHDQTPTGRLLTLLSTASKPILSPIVQFSNGKICIVPPFEFFIGLGSKGTIIRLQLPIKLAWALTIHKSQGMTLSRCMIQAADAFEVGQVYVAVSRCVSTEGLWISGGNITEKAVMAHQDVISFMNRNDQENIGKTKRIEKETVLTEEQRETIRRNRENALEKRAQRIKREEDRRQSTASSVYFDDDDDDEEMMMAMMDKVEQCRRK
jgi:ATP-dependent DNA helicase PIF1